VSVEAIAPSLAVMGDAPLLRFAIATLVRQCEADALERGRLPEVSIQIAEEEGAVLIRVAGGGRGSVLSGTATGPDLADAELSVVHAIVALHGGILVSGRSDSQAPYFSLELMPA